MNKIKDFLYNNYKIIVPAIIVFALVICLFVYLYHDKYERYRETEEVKAYNYVTESKNEFTLTTIYNRTKELLEINSKDEPNILSFSSPIYTEKSIIFPKEMSLVYCHNNFYQYKITSNSYIDPSKSTIITKDYQDSIKYHFLYDGTNTYFFPDQTTLTIDDETITLSPYSFVIANPGNNINYYDKDSDTFVTKQTTTNQITVKNAYYEIKVMEDKVNYYNDPVLIISDFSKLTLISAKED